MPQSPSNLRKRTALAAGTWLTRERATHYPTIFLALQAVAVLGVIWTGHDMLDVLGTPKGADFASFWTASQAVLTGRPAEAYDTGLHHAAEMALFGPNVGFFAWFYPPMALLLVAPLALLPYGGSLVVWLTVTGAAAVATIRRFIPRAGTLIPILGFPAVFINIGHGQNGFLSTGLLGSGLLLSERRPLLGGALLGCLCYKPQLFPMLGVAVLARRDWRLAAGAVLGVAALAALSTLLFGLDVWLSFLSVLPLARASLEQGLIGFEKMQSVFSAVRLLGGSVTVAYALQTLVAIAAATALWQIWRSGASLPLRAGAIAAAALLGTPFILDYDLVARVSASWSATRRR